MAGGLRSTFAAVAAATALAIGVQSVNAAELPNFRTPKGTSVPDTQIGTCVEEALSGTLPGAADYRKRVTQDGSTIYSAGNGINNTQDGKWIDVLIPKDASSADIRARDMGRPNDDKSSAIVQGTLDLNDPSKKVKLSGIFGANADPSSREAVVEQTTQVIKAVRGCVMGMGIGN